MTDTTQDLRRQIPVKVYWQGQIGTLWIGKGEDIEKWGAVEWSEDRQAWCIEDSEGKCLTHLDHVHGEHKDKAGAVALAKAMILDGRMPTPEEALDKAKTARKQRREQRAKQPSEIKRRKERAEQDRLSRAHWDADREAKKADKDDPLYDVILDAIDITDPDLWKSNSFARLRDRLLLLLRADIAELESNLSIVKPIVNIDRISPADLRMFGLDRKIERLARAREILALVLRNDGGRAPS